MARSLVGRGAIEVPVGKLVHVSDLVWDRPALGTKSVVAINPNVFSLDAVALGQGKVRSKKFGVISGRRGHE